MPNDDDRTITTRQGDRVEKPKINRQVGIQYIEELDIDLFLYALRNLTKFRATEKMDGVNLVFGIDFEGRFYTSRESKNEHRICYSPEEWGSNGAANVFTSAHTFLADHTDQIKTALQPGESVVVEVMFGKQPNAIIYGLDGLSYIVVLKPFGTTPLERCAEVVTAMADIEASTMINGVATFDGIELTEVGMTHRWRLVGAREIPPSVIDDVDASAGIKAIETFASAKNVVALQHGVNITNHDVMRMALTDVSGDIKTALKVERDRLDADLTTLKERAVQPFMDALVDGVKPQLQIADPDVPVGIEGVVFFDPDTELEFKMVDRNIFAATNRFFYRAREVFKGTVKDTDPLTFIRSQGGILGNAKTRIIDLLGVDLLAQARHTGRILKTVQGATITDTVNQFVATVMKPDADFIAVRKKSLAICDSASYDLLTALSIFKRDWHTYTLYLKNGTVAVSYTPEIVNRTLLASADANQQLQSMRAAIAGTSNFADLVLVLFGKKLEAIHSDTTSPDGDTEND